jgi:hypothetical protein
MKLPPLVDAARYSGGSHEDDDIPWGERPIGFLAKRQEAEQIQAWRLQQDARLASVEHGSLKLTRRTKRKVKESTAMQEVNPVEASTASASLGSLETSLCRVQSQLHEVLDRTHHLSSKSTLKNSSISTLSKEVLLSKREHTLPARFLPSLKAEVDDLRLGRQESLRNWWEESIVKVAERVSKNMPLCRGGPPQQQKLVVSPVTTMAAEGIDPVGGNRCSSSPVTTHAPNDMDHHDDAAQNEPQRTDHDSLQTSLTPLTNCVTSSVCRSRQVPFSVAELLKGHPSFRISPARAEVDASNIGVDITSSVTSLLVDSNERQREERVQRWTATTQSIVLDICKNRENMQKVMV